MQRRSFVPMLCAVAGAVLGVSGLQAQPVPKIAVTDLAYTTAVAQYF